MSTRKTTHCKLHLPFLMVVLISCTAFAQTSDLKGIEPNQGVVIQQVDFEFEQVSVLNSNWGRLTADPNTLAEATGLTEGFLNMFTSNGWPVPNLPLSVNDNVGSLTTYFHLGFDGGSQEVEAIDAFITYTEQPLYQFVEGQPSVFPVGNVSWNAEGYGLEPVTEIGDPPPLFIEWNPDGTIAKLVQPNVSNVQAAKNQCFPMAVANSLQYLEDRFGLEVPHDHKPGQNGDDSLVGQLDAFSGRRVSSRASGSGVTAPQMIQGKFRYLSEFGLSDKLVHKHQGRGFTMPDGDFSDSGITSTDKGSSINWEWICEELRHGEDVELCYSHSSGGHAVRLIGCGTRGGVPYVTYVHDRKQANDSEGLEEVTQNVVDLDGDGMLNLGSSSREIRFVFSESMATPTPTPDGTPDNRTPEPNETPEPNKTPIPEETPIPTKTIPPETPKTTPSPTPTKQADDCYPYFSIEEPYALPTGGNHGDILVYTGGAPFVLPGGSNQELLQLFHTMEPGTDFNAGLDGFDILSLDTTDDPTTGMQYNHRIVFTTEDRFTVNYANHPLAGNAITDGDLLLRNGGVIRNAVLIAPLNLLSEDGEKVEFLGIDAVEVEGLINIYDSLRFEVISTSSEVIDRLGNFTVNIIFSFEEINEEYMADTGSVLPAGTMVSADDLIKLTFSPSGVTGQVIRSGEDGVPSPVTSILEGWRVEDNRGLDAACTCLPEEEFFDQLLQIYFSTSLDDNIDPLEFMEGDMLLHDMASHTSQVVHTNPDLTGNEERKWGLDGLDLFPEKYPFRPTPVPTDTERPTPTHTFTQRPTNTPTPFEPTPTEFIPPQDCFTYFTIEEPYTLPTGGNHGDILVDTAGAPFVLPGGANPELLEMFVPLTAEFKNAGLDGFDILQLDMEIQPGAARPQHKIIFTTETKFAITNSNHPLAGGSGTDGDLFLKNGGVILNHVIIQPLQLLSEDGNKVEFLGIDALETEGFIKIYDQLAMRVIRRPEELLEFTANQAINIIFSFEEVNEEYIADTGSVLPAGTLVSADDLILLRFFSGNVSGRVIRSGADGIPAPIPSVFETWNVEKNRGFDAVSNTCISEDIVNDRPLDILFFSTSMDDETQPIEFSEGDMLLHSLNTHTNHVVHTNFELTNSDDRRWGLDGLDLYPGIPDYRPTPTFTHTPIRPTDTPTQIQPTSTPTERVTATPTPTLPCPTSPPVTLIPLTPIPVTPIPIDTVIVLDHLRSTEDLSNGTDYDNSYERELVISWNFSQSDARDHHIYVRVDGATPKFLGRTNDGFATYFRWRGGSNAVGQFKDGPEFGHKYQFFVFIVTQSGSPRVRGPFRNKGPVEYLPLLVQREVIVTDDISSTQDLSNGSDYDFPGERELNIVWSFQSTDIRQSHIYVSEDGGSPTFLGRTTGVNATHFQWKQGTPLLASMHQDGPQFGHTYQFFVFGITQSGSPRVIGPIRNAGPVEYYSAVPSGQVIVTDDMSTQFDLSNGKDFDNQSERELVIRWNLPNVNASDFEISVIIDGSAQSQLLGRTGSGAVSHFRWNEQNNLVESPFDNGPLFNHTYTFEIRGIAGPNLPAFAGPFSNQGPVEFIEKP